MPFHFTPIWPVTPEHCLLDKSPISVPGEINAIPLTSSQRLMRVSGCTAGVRSVITGMRWQMGACPSEAAQQGAKWGWGACQDKGLPHPSKISPSSSAARQQCRSWAVTHTILLHHYPLGFFFFLFS